MVLKVTLYSIQNIINTENESLIATNKQKILWHQLTVQKKIINIEINTLQTGTYKLECLLSKELVSSESRKNNLISNSCDKISQKNDTSLDPFNSDN